MNRNTLCFLNTVIACVFASNTFDCNQQSECLNFETHCPSQDNLIPQGYVQACISWNYCSSKTDGTLSHVCNNPWPSGSMHKDEGWVANTPVCYTVLENSFAYFGVKDKTGCSASTFEQSFNINGLSASCISDSVVTPPGSYYDCEGGNSMECLWKVYVPGCTPVSTTTTSTTTQACVTNTITDRVTIPPVTITVPPVTSTVTIPPVTNTITVPPVTSTVTIPPVTSTVTVPPVTSTVTIPPVTKTVTVPPVVTTHLPPPVSGCLKCPGNSSCVKCGNKYECKCKLGYYGSLCNLYARNCPSTCKYGNYALVNRVYICKCFEGYVGVNCEVKRGI